MGINYKTIQGDTFDIIAKKFYQDEYSLFELIRQNPKHIDIVFFSSGTNIYIPKLKEKINIGGLPPWRL